MSNRFSPKFEPICCNVSGAYGLPGGPTRDELVAHNSQLDTARRTALAEGSFAAGVNLPARLLAEYRERRSASELGRILATAKRVREGADRVIVLGSPTTRRIGELLFHACCHPFHNEQGRGDRGGRPRVYFHDQLVDNDATQGLLDLVDQSGKGATVDDRFALVAIDHGDMGENAARAVRLFYQRIRQQYQLDEIRMAELVAVVASSVALKTAADDLRLAALDWSPAAAPRFAVFSAVGLVTAAILGVDVIRFLEGAAAMAEWFRESPVGDNPPLDLAAVLRLADKHSLGWRLEAKPAALRSLETWLSVAAPQLLGTHADSKAILLCVEADTHRRDNVIWPEGLTAIADALSRPTARRVLLTTPAVDESSVGQLAQMFLATQDLFERFNASDR